MTYDPHYHPYPSYRVPVYAKKGMVSTSQPLAAQAGLDILKKGGNAIDAAIATAASLTVLEPASNGIGGDAFALVWTNDQLYGLNASGPSPQSISIDALKEKGYRDFPKYGMIPVTVPRAPAAWAALSKRFGKLPLSQVLQPAIQYAKEGFPLAPTLRNNGNKRTIRSNEYIQAKNLSHGFKRLPQMDEHQKQERCGHPSITPVRFSSLAKQMQKRFIKVSLRIVLMHSAKNIAAFYPRKIWLLMSLSG